MPDAPSLRLEADECMTLSPTSERFKSAYRQVQLRQAEEVRAALGLSEAAAKALQEGGMCCPGGAAPSFLPRPEDLDADDADTRTAARNATRTALAAYVESATPAAFANLTPAFNRYLELSKALINVVTLADIEVANGATLTISANTRVVYANKVTIHGTGRIVCHGPTTFKIAALEGVRRTLTATALGSAASFTARH